MVTALYAASVAVIAALALAAWALAFLAVATVGALLAPYAREAAGKWLAWARGRLGW